LIPLLLAAALATDPTVEATAGRNVVLQGPMSGGVAFDLALGGRPLPRLGVEGRAQGQLLSGGGARLRALPMVRGHLVDPERSGAFRPSLATGFGVAVGESPRPVAAVAVDVDLPTGWPHHARAGVSALFEPGGGLALGVRVGFVGRLAAPRSPESPTAPPRDEPPATGAPGGRWWDPSSCAWVDRDPGRGWKPGDGIALPPGADAATGPARVAVADRQGWLVVVGPPASVVQVAGQRQPIGPDGLVRLRTPEGELAVEVVGGGRTDRFEVAIADGYTLWLRVRPPPEVRVLFGVGSSEVSPADQVAIGEIARNRGAYALRISGSYSPEGDLASNIRLAAARGEAIAALLRDAGAPSHRIVVLAPRPPEPGRSAAEQRAVVIEPVAPEAP
jgi:hypothetical protein